MEDNKNKRKVSGSQKSVSEDDNRRCSLEPYDESIVNSMKDSRYPHLLVLST